MNTDSSGENDSVCVIEREKQTEKCRDKESKRDGERDKNRENERSGVRGREKKKERQKYDKRQLALFLTTQQKRKSLEELTLQVKS